MRKYSIPTAESRNFSNYDLAEAYVHHTVEKFPIVIKASGLAAGKGVIIAATKKEAIKVLKDIMLDKVFGDAGLDVVIEEYLYGDEISVLTFSDRKTTRTLPSGEDHKRIGDGDKGPNTGGMGVVGPVHETASDVMQEIEEKILKPTFEGLKAEGVFDFPLQHPCG
jgi:phosphoribosylamine--glycine ligase / phosphoribosylformylglycinamidine cyclo-ligase